VVLPDAPKGTSLFGQRHLPDYADALSKAVDFGRSHANLPVWQIATSLGSIAVVNGAAHLGSKVSGVVLASPVTRRGRAGERPYLMLTWAQSLSRYWLSTTNTTLVRLVHRATIQCALGPDTFAAQGAGHRDEQPDYERLRPMRRDVAAWLSWDRGHGGVAHLRMY